MQATQLDLFSAPPAQPASPIDALMGDEADNFRWWCLHGNREMCAGVLMHRFQMSLTEAQALVQANYSERQALRRAA